MKITSVCLLAGVMLILSACSSDKQAQDKTADKAASPQKSSAGRVENGTPAVSRASPATIAKGKNLYQQNCVFCHQADAIGKPGVAPSLTNQEFLKVSSDKFLKGTIRDGRGGTGMPPFAHLGKSGIDAIVAYLRSHAKVPNISGRIDAQPVSQGDQRLGKLWYNQICLTCHGKNGDGYARGGTGTAIGKAGFLDKVSDGFLRVTIREGRSNTRMLGFSGPAAMANLSEREIDDIIAYLRTVPSK